MQIQYHSIDYVEIIYAFCEPYVAINFLNGTVIFVEGDEKDVDKQYDQILWCIEHKQDFTYDGLNRRILV